MKPLRSRHIVKLALIISMAGAIQVYACYLLTYANCANVANGCQSDPGPFGASADIEGVNVQSYPNGYNSDAAAGDIDNSGFSDNSSYWLSPCWTASTMTEYSGAGCTGTVTANWPAGVSVGATVDYWSDSSSGDCGESLEN